MAKLQLKTYLSSNSIGLTRSGDQTLIIQLPDSYDKIVGVIPLGYTPRDTWDTKIIFIYTIGDLLAFRVQGSDTQSYIIYASVLYY